MTEQKAATGHPLAHCTLQDSPTTAPETLRSCFDPPLPGLRQRKLRYLLAAHSYVQPRHGGGGPYRGRDPCLETRHPKTPVFTHSYILLQFYMGLHLSPCLEGIHLQRVCL